MTNNTPPHSLEERVEHTFPVSGIPDILRRIGAEHDMAAALCEHFHEDVPSADRLRGKSFTFNALADSFDRLNDPALGEAIDDLTKQYREHAGQPIVKFSARQMVYLSMILDTLTSLRSPAL